MGKPYDRDMAEVIRLTREKLERESQAAARTTAAAGERRAAVAEVRVPPGGRRLVGHAAKFGTEARIGGFVETIAPGAFAASLAAGRDIIALQDHDATKVLARTSSGTLRLSEDATGLAFEIDLPNTSVAHDVLALAQRGDLGGMSFGFLVPEGGDDWNGDRRVLTRIDLKEISVVSAWPAYPQTVVHARSAPKGKPSLQLALRFLETL